MLECPRCNKRYGTDMSFCPADGAALVSLTSQTALAVGAVPIQTERDWGTLRPGMEVGGYEITGKIGEGGMGEVYAGVHPKIGKQVAIKVLQRNWSKDAKMAARFLQEAQAVNKIGHENIVDIFAYGELPTGELYLVMELLNGQSLGSRLEKAEPLDKPEAVQILIDVCEALNAAHAMGIVHRDLKPDNIFLAVSKTGKRTTKLLDFGIARVLGATGMRSTQSGMAVGTPHYMSPEQCLGKDVDARTDIYALGVIIFEIFTGRVPFDGDAFIQVMNGHISEPPPDPRSIAEVSNRLAELILGCMQKKPTERVTLAQVRQGLEEVGKEMRGEAPVPAAAPAPQQPKTVPQKIAAVDPPKPAPEPTPPKASVQPPPKPKASEKAKPTEKAKPAERPKSGEKPDFLALRKDPRAVPKPRASKDPAIFDVIDEFEASAKNLGERAGWSHVGPTAADKRKRTSTQVIAKRRGGSYWLVVMILLVCASATAYLYQKSSQKVVDEEPVDEEPILEPKRSVEPATVEAGTGKVTVHVSDSSAHPVNATFMLDKTVFARNTSLFEASLPPGSRKLTITAHGYRTVTKVLKIEEGKRVSLDVTLQHHH